MLKKMNNSQAPLMISSGTYLGTYWEVLIEKADFDVLPKPASVLYCREDQFLFWVDDGARTHDPQNHNLML